MAAGLVWHQRHPGAMGALTSGRDLRSAEIRLRNALDQDPANLTARVQLGSLLLREGEPRRLLAEVTADNLAPEVAAEVLLLRGRAHTALGELAEAEGDLTAAMANGGESSAALLALAEVRRHGNDLAGAETLVDRALAKSPDDAAPLTVKGDLRRQRGDPEGALKAFLAALAHRPDDITAHVGAAIVHLGRDQYAEAQEHVARVLALAPGHAYARMLRAALLEHEGKAAEALDMVEPMADQLDEVPEAQMLLARLHLRLDHTGQALRHAQRALALAPGSAAARMLLGAAWTQANKPSEVIDLLEPAQASADAGSLARLGKAFASVGRTDAAVRVLERAAKMNPNDTDLRVELDASRQLAGKDGDRLTLPQTAPPGLVLAEGLLRAGRLAEADTALKTLKQAQPDSPLADTLLGMIHRRMGERRIAKDYFQSALSRHPALYAPAANLIEMAHEDGDLAEVRRLLHTILAAAPANAQAMAEMAALAGAEGDGEAALRWLGKAVAAEPNAVWPRLRLIGMCLAVGRPNDAEATAEKMATAFPDHPEALRAIGWVRHAAGRETDALAAFAHAAEVEATSPMAQERWGRTLMALGHDPEARDALNRALRMDADYYPAWRDLVTLEGKAGGLKPALKVVEQVKAAKVGNKVLAPVIKGDAYMEAGQYHDAETAYAGALALRPASDLLVRRVLARMAGGDLKGAKDLLSTWLIAHVDDDNVRLVLAEMLLVDRDYPAAIHEYETLAARRPFDAMVLNDLAWLYGRTGDPRGLGLGLARRAHELAPRDAAAADTLGWQLERRGEVGEALPLLERAHRQRPDNGEIAYHYAVALDHGGRTAEARAVVGPISAHLMEDSTVADGVVEFLHRIGAVNTTQ
jgi:putative PEP-CTERM system TPR-repeat lipoprotein